MVIWDAYNFCFVIGMFLCSKTVIDELRWMRFLKFRVYVELNVANRT